MVFLDLYYSDGNRIHPLLLSIPKKEDSHRSAFRFWFLNTGQGSLLLKYLRIGKMGQWVNREE